MFLCYNNNMREINLDESIKKEGELDKRPWLMDALLYIGNCMAAITHIKEKQQYLIAEIENGDDDQPTIDKKTEEIANLNMLRSNVYAGYNTMMTYIMEHIPEAKKEYRCLLKHTSTMIVMALEIGDTLDNGDSDEVIKQSFNAFAGAVSLAIGIEFKSCIRCIYDGMKKTSDEAL